VDSQVASTGQRHPQYSPRTAKRVGIISSRAGAVNFAFNSRRNLFCCAYTSVYTLRVKVPGNPHPWYRLKK
jgi:hypothetical protein